MNDSQNYTGDDSSFHSTLISTSLQRQKQEMLHQLTTNLNKLLEEAIQSSPSSSPSSSSFSSPKKNGHSSHRDDDDKKKSSLTQGIPPPKVFAFRKSELTILMENPHILAFRNMFLAVLIIFTLHTLLREWVVMNANHNNNTATTTATSTENGVLQYDHVATLLSLFSGFSHVVIVWLYMFTATQLGLYLALILFARLRWKVSSMHLSIRTFDYLYLAVYLLYMVGFFILPVWFARQQYMSPACMIIVLCEQLRFLMKGYAFVRESVSRIVTLQRQHSAALSSGEWLSSAHSSEEFNSAEGVPDFSHYLYFMFAPTAVYRDHYPRTDVIHWDFVLHQMMSIVLCIVFVYYAYFRYMAAVFYDFSHHNLSLPRLLLDLCSCIIPGSISLLLGFFTLLHAWMNAFAEMLRFADRQFYRHWWTVSNFPAYYRLWNCVVHDWLYTYVYRDFILLTGNRFWGLMLTFILSAFFHEYVLSLAFGFFFPVLLVLFGGFGVCFAFVKGRAAVWNIGIWFSLFVGMGLMTFGYTLEWYARQNCATHLTAPWDFFVPRIFLCWLS